MSDGPAPDDPVARYRRVCAAVTALGELATGTRGGGLARVLAGDEVVIARMWAAAAVLACDEPPPGRPELPVEDHPERDPAAPGLLEAAVGWQRYARSPATTGLDRACAADIARGMLRLWARRQDDPPRGALGRRVRQRQARITLLGLAGSRCAALRSELRDAAAALSRRDIAVFPAHAVRRAGEVAARVAEEVDWTLPAPGPAGPDLGGLPAGPGPVGGDRVTALFGVVFGLGSALTLGRLTAALLPGWAGGAAVLSAVTGIVLAAWVVAARRLSARRGALDRWSGEVTAAVRAALEQYIALRVLAAEAAAAGVPRTTADRPGDLRRFAG